MFELISTKHINITLAFLNFYVRLFIPLSALCIRVRAIIIVLLANSNTIAIGSAIHLTIKFYRN